jgi:L-ribulose-5-phosphate 3-epimerase
MKPTINIWAFPADWPMDRILSVAVDAGFEAIELDYGLPYRRQGAPGPTSPGVGHPLSPETTDDEARALREQCLNAGLEVSSLASGIFWQVNLLSDDADERTEAKGHVRHMIRLGAALGVDALLIVPGSIGPFEAGPPVVADYQVAYDRALDDFRELAIDAGRAGIVLGIETVWNKFLTSPMEMRAFVDAVDSPYVGVYLDVGNVLRTGYPEHWIRILGSRICKVHLKDFSLRVGNLGGFVDLLRGDVDFRAVMAALREVGYDDYLVVEMFTQPELAEHRVHQAAQDAGYILRL